MADLKDIYDHPRIKEINAEVVELVTKIESLVAEAEAIALEMTGQEWSIGINGTKSLTIRHQDSSGEMVE